MSCYCCSKEQQTSVEVYHTVLVNEPHVIFQHISILLWTTTCLLIFCFLRSINSIIKKFQHWKTGTDSYFFARKRREEPVIKISLQSSGVPNPMIPFLKPWMIKFKHLRGRGNYFFATLDLQSLGHKCYYMFDIINRFTLLVSVLILQHFTTFYITAWYKITNLKT